MLVPKQPNHGLGSPVPGDLFGPILPSGFILRPNCLDLATQNAVWAAIQDIEAAAPLRRLMTKTGKFTSAAMTNCGQAGWWSDAKGYRYETRDPQTAAPWPPMPDVFWTAVKLAARQSPWPMFSPDACLINFYTAGAKMGLHQDRDEKDFNQPIITICLGDDADFLVGGPNRSDKTAAVVVRSGDAMIMGGEGRLYFHGIRKIYPGTSPLPNIAGRYSLAFRKAL